MPGLCWDGLSGQHHQYYQKGSLSDVQWTNTKVFTDLLYTVLQGKALVDYTPT